ncbi:MAG: hypothetical protein L3K00_00550 [Thermoplasmata archaeon]|nr:hypothetical protein [Thermoplasmata archaeon]
MDGTLPAHLAIADITGVKDPLWETFSLRITPSLVTFEDGKLVSRLDGRRFVGLDRGDLARLREMVPGRGDGA